MDFAPMAACCIKFICVACDVFALQGGGWVWVLTLVEGSVYQIVFAANDPSGVTQGAGDPLPDA